MMLGDMGAEILKIEEPEHGDDTRGWGPYINGQGSFYLALNRSKKSIALDLKTAEGADALRRLIATADVLIENFRPGSLARLGFGYEEVAAGNPRLIYCSITGYGQTGPHAQLPGYDAVIQGEAGIMDMTGFPEGEPTRVGVAITDYLAGLYASQGILLALHERHSSGRGQHVDIALFDAMLSVLRLPHSMLVATGDADAVGNDHLSIAPPSPSRQGRPGHRRGGKSTAMGALLPGDRAPRPPRRPTVSDQRRPHGASGRAQGRARAGVCDPYRRPTRREAGGAPGAVRPGPRHAAGG
jgi:crotonobetainyl-CoA:carnitine CoA-transferase CaiB-like acyl-CoA transferase